jgi:hypothetical protein
MVTVKSSGPVNTKTVVCTKCAYELEYTGEDVKSSGGYYMGEYDVSFFIVCPRTSCQQKVFVKAWDAR